MKIQKHLSILAAFACLSACASYDAQDRYLLGASNEANIALQSERNVELPNSKKVESSSGVRAVAAVKALNEGQTKELAAAGTGGAE